MASAVAPDAAAGSDPRARAEALRELVALLGREGEALAAMDLDAIEAVQEEKKVLLDRVDRLVHAPRALRGSEDAHTISHIRSLALEARRLNVDNARLMTRLAATYGSLADVLRGPSLTYAQPRVQSRFF